MKILSLASVSLATICLLLSSQVQAATNAEQAKGLWLSADKAAVIEFAACSDLPSALCGKIVWDKEAGTANDDCGLLVAKLKDWNDEAWRNGWIFDPRSKKNYKGVIRIKDNVMHMRAFIGTELLGETEEMTRVTSIPPGCKAK